MLGLKRTAGISGLESFILNKAGRWLTMTGVLLVVVGVLTMMEPPRPVRES